MDPMMGLVVGWTIVGAFIFTVAITCLSLIGLVRFADKKQQRALFSAVVIEVIVAGAAKAAGLVNFDAKAVESENQTVGYNAGVVDSYNAVTDAGDAPTGPMGATGSTAPTGATGPTGSTGGHQLTPEQTRRLLQNIRVKPGTAQAAEKQRQLDRLNALPPGGRIDPSTTKEIRDSNLIKRPTTFRPPPIPPK